MGSLLAAVALATTLAGTVHAPGGTPVNGAVVVLTGQSKDATTATDANGAFSFPDVTLPATLEVSAPGFATLRRLVTASPVDIMLSPASVADSVVVAAERASTWRDPSTGATVLSARDLELLPAVTPDEALRAVAGFSLFRRSSSRSGNPTTHGVTMRGLSASGSSRGLVLLDGVPINDGFGGWVTWTRLPSMAIARVDVERGAEGDAFGSDALGGVIRFVTPTGQRPTLSFGGQGGSLGVGGGDASAGGRHGAVSMFGAASYFKTDGSIPVEPKARGAADTPTDAEWTNAFARVDFYRPGRLLTLSGWGGKDDRGNGTKLQRNRNSGGTFSASYQALGLTTALAARVSVSPNHYYQTFTTVGAGRATETLTSTQFIDATTTRAVVEAGGNIPGGHLLVRGTLTRGNSTFEEQKPSSTLKRELRDDSESVSATAGFAILPRVSLGAGIRHEWRTAPGDDSTRDGATVGHVSAAWQPATAVSVRGSIATSHRWPTLNELARNFQVGQALTVANPNLKPESAMSTDVAVSFTRRRWSVSASAFRTVVDGAIANVTLPSGSVPGFTGTARERRNAGEAHALGTELDGEVRPLSWLRVRVSAAIIDSRFRKSLEPLLEGLVLPQVPKVSFSFAADAHLPWSIDASALYHAVSSQFDDDRNTLLLADGSQLDLRVGGRISRFGWFIVVENATDARLEVGRTTPTFATLAPPRAVRVGVTISR